MIRINTSYPEVFYKSVIEMLLQGESNYLKLLRQQFITHEVRSINYDGYGISIDLSIDPSTKIVSPEIDFARIDGLCGIDEKNWICGFALFINDGCIASLDCYPVSVDAWPNEELYLKFWVDTEENGFWSNCRSEASLKRYLLPEDVVLGSEMTDDGKS